MFRLLTTLLLLHMTLVAKAQTITSSASGGDWDASSTWIGGVVPIFTNSTHVVITGPVSISQAMHPIGTPLIMDQIEITDGMLLVGSDAELMVRNGNGTDLSISGNGKLIINGKFTSANNITFAGNNASNFIYQDSSVYEHQYTSAASSLPLADYSPASTIIISAMTTGTMDASWNIPIGTLLYNSPNQGSGTVNFSGMLRNINGDVRFLNTGSSGIVYFNLHGVSNGDTSSAIQIAGDFDVSGQSRIALTSSGTVDVFAGGDFRFHPGNAAGYSQSSGTGTASLTVGGNIAFSSGIWNLATGANATGHLVVGGDLVTTGGSVSQTAGGSSCSLTFNGSRPQLIDANGISATSLAATFDNTAGFHLSGTLLVSNQLNLKDGTLSIGTGSLIVNGAVLQDTGEIQSFGSGALIIGGSGALPAKLNIKDNSAFETFQLNRMASSVNIGSDFSVTTLALYAGTLNNEGIVTVGHHGLVDVKILSGDSRGSVSNPLTAADQYNIHYTNTLPFQPGPEFPADEKIILNLTKSGTGTLSFTSDIVLGGDLIVEAGTVSDGGIPRRISIGRNLIAEGVIGFSSSVFTFENTDTVSLFSGVSRASFASINFHQNTTIACNLELTGNMLVAPGIVVTSSKGQSTFNGTSTIVNGGTISLNDIIISAGATLTAPRDTLGIRGNLIFTNSSSTFIHNEGTLLFNNLTTISGPATKVFHNLVVTKTGTLTSAITLSLLGDLLNNGAVSLTAGTLSFAGTRQRVYGNSGQTTFFATTINTGTKVTMDLPFTNSDILIINDSLKCNAGFSALSALTLSPTGTLVVSQKSFSVAGATTVSAPAALIASMDADATFGGNISSSGTLILGGKTNFSTNTTLTGNGSKIFNSIHIAGSFTPNSVYTITGDLVIDDNGTLNAGGNTTIFNGEDSHFSNSHHQPAAFNNLTVSPGSFLNCLDSITVKGTFVISGTLAATEGFHAYGDVSVSVDTGSLIIHKKFTVMGNLTVSSGAVMSALDGADAQLYGNISASGSISIAGDTWLNGRCVLTGNGIKTFNTVHIEGQLTPNATMSITGDILIGENGTVYEGSSTITFSGASSVISNNGQSPALFHNILISAGSTATNQCIIHINGTFRSSGNFMAANDLFVAGTFTISRGGLFTSSFITDIAGNLTISGNYNSTSVTRFTGVTRISGAGSKNFNTIIIVGLLTSFNGVINIQGDLQNDGVFFHNNGLINFSGDAAKRIFSTLTNAAPIGLYNVSITGGATDTDLVFDMDTHVAGVLSVNSGSEVVAIDLDGKDDHSIFTLLSTNDDPAADGSIAAIPDNATVSGKLRIQRYISGEGRIYRYLSSPFNGADATVAAWQKAFPITGKFDDPSDPGVICEVQAQKNNPSLFYFDEVSQSFLPFPVSGSASENELIPGKGYAAFIRRCLDSTLVSVSGKLIKGVNRGLVNLPVSDHEPVATYNNLVGNPYPSAINWDKAILYNVSPTIAIRDNSTGIFRYYTRGGSGATDIPNGAIAGSQAFWIRTTGADPSITLNENAKTTSTSTSGTIFFRGDDTDRFEITFAREGNGNLDKACIVLSPAASSEQMMDPLDAPKMNNRRDDPFEELPDVFTSGQVNGVALAVNAVPSINCGVPYQLGVKDPEIGSCHFSFKQSGLFTGVGFEVFDHLENRAIDSDDAGLYHFTVTNDVRSQSLNRFELTFFPRRTNVSLPVSSPSLICGNATAEIRILRSQPGVNYFAQTAHQTVSDTVRGNPGEITLQLNSQNNRTGRDTVRVYAMGPCTHLPLDTFVIIQRKMVNPPALSVINVCEPGPVQFTAPGANENETYHWYLNDTTSIPYFSGRKFDFDLREHKAFYVSLYDSATGCSSARVSVTATLLQNTAAVISVLSADHLQSNYKTGNQWFQNDEPLPDTTSLLKIKESGVYRLSVSTNGCILEASRYIGFTATQDLMGIEIFPNPATKTITVRIPGTESSNILLYNGIGELITEVPLIPDGNFSSALIDLDQYASGVYFINLRMNNISTSRKIIKE